MTLSVIKLLFAAMWFVVGAALLVANGIAPDWVAQQRFNATHAALFAFLLGLWNLRRWFMTRAASGDATPRQRPLEAKREDGRPFEYNPEFDFTKQDANPDEPKK